MTAVILCIIITFTISLGLGVGLGYNYCYVDLKIVTGMISIVFFYWVRTLDLTNWVIRVR